jgi:hypothetical protein
VSIAGVLGTERRKREVDAAPDSVSEFVNIDESTKKVNGSPIETRHCCKRREGELETR